MSNYYSPRKTKKGSTLRCKNCGVKCASVIDLQTHEFFCQSKKQIYNTPPPPAMVDIMNARGQAGDNIQFVKNPQWEVLAE